MTNSAKIPFALAAGVLATVYYYLLDYIVGLTMARHWPSWWFGLFPSRHVAGVAWLVTLHTIGVLSAAFPVGFASVIIARNRGILLGAIAGFLATAAAF